MNKRFVSVLLFALVVSAVASTIVYRLVLAQMSASSKAAGTQVVVATHTLGEGLMIKAEDVTLAEWNGPVPQGALTNVADAVGRGVIDTIYEHEAILDSRIAGKGVGAGLASIIPAGMRAVAVRVNDVVGVGGFLTPGTHVDVLIAGNPPGSQASATGTRTKTLLQDIEVLSAGQNLQKDAEGKPVNVTVVNLLVTPAQAEILSLASNETRIQLVLRNPLDKEITKTPGTAVSYLFAGGEPPAEAPSAAPKAVVHRKAAPPPPPPVAPVVEKPAPPITVEVILGSKRSETTFPDAEKQSKPEGKQP